MKRTLFGWEALLLSVLVAGCGSSKSTLTQESLSSTAKTLSECNKFQGSGVAGVVTTDERTDRLRVFITQLSSDFAVSSKTLSFQGYGYQPNGTLVRTSSPFYLNFEFHGDGKKVLSQSIQGLNASTLSGLQALAKSYGYPTLTTDQTMSHFDIVLEGVTATYDVLQVVVTSAGSPSWSPILMPPFAVNPDAYAADHIAELYNLHPFLSGLGSGASDSVYAAQAQDLCTL